MSLVCRDPSGTPILPTTLTFFPSIEVSKSNGMCSSWTCSRTRSQESVLAPRVPKSIIFGSVVILGISFLDSKPEWFSLVRRGCPALNCFRSKPYLWPQLGWKRAMAFLLRWTRPEVTEHSESTHKRTKRELKRPQERPRGDPEGS